MGGSAVDSVDNSPQTPSCPRYPQPYDDDDLISEVLRTLPEDHNKHSLKWYNFWGEPHFGYLPVGCAPYCTPILPFFEQSQHSSTGMS
jgi:hypothetical protein